MTRTIPSSAPLRRSSLPLGSGKRPIRHVGLLCHLYSRKRYIPDKHSERLCAITRLVMRMKTWACMMKVYKARATSRPSPRATAEIRASLSAVDKRRLRAIRANGTLQGSSVSSDGPIPLRADLRVRLCVVLPVTIPRKSTLTSSTRRLSDCGPPSLKRNGKGRWNGDTRMTKATTDRSFRLISHLECPNPLQRRKRASLKISTRPLQPFPKKRHQRAYGSRTDRELAAKSLHLLLWPTNGRARVQIVILLIPVESDGSRLTDPNMPPRRRLGCPASYRQDNA